ncbi:hypothetical protein L873DRAFT_1822796 [Choiromyces venosus 120613-1]|uniref:Uncharacterized protein n=1 Tax=Choiromyces venosus 120613-1 TaxID=1336337 RepID=A0A3N4IWY7_9PEZI|nr:hypothetical protein L873DRAFT_1822796 [Choiromyces venosus 120613-1]
MVSLPIPSWLKTLFDAFPLLTYPANPLPARCPKFGTVPSLYVFTTPEDADSGNPSFNPSCLKWQAYLKFNRIEFETVPSNNHASPTGALPFMISQQRPMTESADLAVIPSNKLAAWIDKNGYSLEGEADMDSARAKVFLTLVNAQLRGAWLYALYLEPNNSEDLARKLYCGNSVSAVSSFLLRQTKAAAQQQLLQAHPGGFLDPREIYADASEALEAISTILGGDTWFFGGRDPGLFDASVFAYTHLILTLKWHSKENALFKAIMEYGNLVGHERRIREAFFPEAKAPEA